MRPQKRYGAGGLLIGFVSVMCGLTVVVYLLRPSSRCQVRPVVTGIKINLNTTDIDRLCLLSGIGPRLALRIVQLRAQIGGYTDVDQLLQVRGIGPTILARICPLLECGPMIPQRGTRFPWDSR